MTSFNCKPFFFLRNFWWICTANKEVLSITNLNRSLYFVLGALLGTENLSFIFSFWRLCVFMSQLTRLQIIFSSISEKFNFISDSITKFSLDLAAQWVIDNSLYFCWVVLKYLWSVLLLPALIRWHSEGPSVKGMQLEWQWWVVPLAITFNFLSACPCICKRGCTNTEGEQKTRLLCR